MIQTMQNEGRSRAATQAPETSIRWTLRRGAIACATALLAIGAFLASPSAAPSAPTAESAAPAAQGKTASAIFAGGCFWCMEKPFDELPGVTATTSGYTGGKLANPTYEQVSTGNTGHIEAVRVDYDPSIVSYATLVDMFWPNVDPLDDRGQFCDKGYQYTSAIFYGSGEEKAIAEASKQALEKSGRLGGPIATRIVPATEFYDAEDYHQNYYEKNPIRYRFYRSGCGRDARLETVWGAEAGGKKVLADAVSAASTPG